jgi:hypothetical protein
MNHPGYLNLKYRYIGIVVLFFFFQQYSYSAKVNLVTSKNPTLTEKFAAEEVRDYLLKISGKEIDIRNSGSASGFNIFIGNSLNQDVRKLNLENEEYVIRPVKNGMVISGGGNRGTLYAVYDFLEKLGCRWYYMDTADEIIPALTLDEIIRISSEIDIIERPDFSYRIFQYLTYDIGGIDSEQSKRNLEQIPELIDWLCKNRINIFQFGFDGKNSYQHWLTHKKYLLELQKRDMTVGISGHSYFLFLPDSVLNMHREWWPEINGERKKAGQFCTNNREAVTYYISNIIRFLHENPEVKYVTAWPADTEGWCNCKLCGDDSTVADRYLKLSKTIHKEIVNKFPDVSFSHFAYGSHLEAPGSEIPDPGMEVTICTWGRDFKDNFDNMSAKNGWEGNFYKDDFMKEFNAWSKITDSAGSRLILHEKYLRHLGFGFLPLPLKVIQDDIRYFRSRGLDGFELPMGFMGRRTKALNFHATAKLMWDSEINIKLLEEDYFSKFYGEQAYLMQMAYENVVLAQPNLKYFTELQKLERNISPVEKYTHKDRDYALKALMYFDLADKYIYKALLETESSDIAERIRRFEKSLRYIELEYRGLLELTNATSHIERSGNTADPAEKNIELQFARDCLEKARNISNERQILIRENRYNAYYYLWDVNWQGAICIFYDPDIQKFREIISNKEFTESD